MGLYSPEWQDATSRTNREGRIFTRPGREKFPARLQLPRNKWQPVWRAKAYVLAHEVPRNLLTAVVVSNSFPFGELCFPQGINLLPRTPRFISS